jgi:hypothetical protein
MEQPSGLLLGGSTRVVFTSCHCCWLTVIGFLLKLLANFHSVLAFLWNFSLFMFSLAHFLIHVFFFYKSVFVLCAPSCFSLRGSIRVFFWVFFVCLFLPSWGYMMYMLQLEGEC